MNFRPVPAVVAALAFAAMSSGCVTTSNETAQESPQAAGQANLQLGAAYLRQGNLPVAKEKLERAEKQSPRDPQVHGLLAMLYHRLGEDQKAEREYRTALDLSHDDPEQLNNYAVFLCGVGRVDEGVNRFQEAAKNPLYRTPWAAYTNAGVCLRGAGRDAEARPLFLKALTVRPDYAEAAVQLADLDLKDHRPADAYKRVTEYMKTNVATPDLLLFGWRAARELKDPVGAAQMAWRLQSDFPESEQAHSIAQMSGVRN
jgi:type IV pilus assembly protein PilF